MGHWPMDILLHLGAHSCATKTFQTYLWNNRTQLAKQGLTCWTPKRTRDGLLRGLVRHPARITVEDERYAIRSVGRLRVEIARLRDSGQTGLLMSDENILGSTRDNIEEARLYPLLHERLLRFQPAFEGQNLTIGLSVRSYEDHWASCLTYLVIRGGALPSVDLLDFLTTQPLRWRALVRDIAAVFPQADIVVWPFERMTDQPDAQLRAVWSKGLDLPEPGEVWHNRGADMMRLNAVLAVRGERLSENDFVEAGTRWMPFDEDQCNVLRADYRRDLAWLKAGAEGLARYADGRHSPMHDANDGVHVLAQGADAARNNDQSQGEGRSTPASHPDRGNGTRTTHSVLFGGRHDGIEEKLGRTGAS